MIKVHIVTYTHWDREFRWEFERTRMRLVDCIDHLLEIMELKPAFRSFLFDGQFDLIDDYLEIRPEKKEAIRKIVQEGRAEIGPWYSLPDCSPIQGESVIRNLQYGIKKSKEFGEPLMCGYNVFSFGQIGQLPQIYNNFDIDTALFYKRMDPCKSRYHEFYWESPDGSRLLSSRLGSEARWNFFFAGHIPIVYDKDAWHKDWHYNWGEMGKVFHTADPDSYGWFYDILDPETSFHKKNLRMGMERALATVAGTAAPDCVLMFEGTDFTEPHPLTPDIIAALQEEFRGEIEIVHSTLTEYLDALKAALKNRTDLDVAVGPMRDGPVGSIHTDVYTTHPEVKILNSHVENKLIRYAEPLSAIAWRYGICDYPSGYLEKIWKLMFVSHSHDSMHGLGPKTLVEGQVARLKQATVIAEGLMRKGLENITKEIDTSSCTDTDIFIAVHNPSSFARSEVVEAYVDIPAQVAVDFIVIEDMEGNPVKVQEISRKVNTRAGLYHPRSRNMPFYCTKVRLLFEADKIPACGFKTFRLKWMEKAEYPYPHEDWDAPRILEGSMLTGVNKAENEHLCVTLNNNGTVNIVYKATGKEYTNLNYFLDMGDIGNMWCYNAPGNDRIINSLTAGAQVSVAIHGPLMVRFIAEFSMIVPTNYDTTKDIRSDTTTYMPIKVEYTLKRGQKHLEVMTTINNTVKDHYFKVCMPTCIDAEKTLAEGSMMVMEYPVKPIYEKGVRGSELARHPAQLWYGVADSKEGFAVLTDAAKDYEVLEGDTSTTLAMGLVRGTQLRIPCDNRLWMEYPGDESSQSLQEFTYRYAFLPHEGDWKSAKLCSEGLSFSAPLRLCQFGKQKGMFQTQKSFLEIHGGDLVMTSLQKSENGNILLRFYNPDCEPVQAVIDFGFDVTKAYAVRLDGKQIDELKVNDSVIKTLVGAYKIYTIEVET